MARHQIASPTAVRITTAAASRADDIAARQKRYLLSMGIRTVVLRRRDRRGPRLGWRWVLIVAALVLPYVAVVMANAGAHEIRRVRAWSTAPSGADELRRARHRRFRRTVDSRR